MNEETIVAVFDNPEQADAAVRDLIAADVPESAISRHTGGTMPMTEATEPAPPRDEGFWSRLFGGDRDYDHHVYDRSIEAGSTVVSVIIPEAHVVQVTEILDRHSPIDIDERAEGYGYRGAAGDGMTGIAPASYAETQYEAPVARTAGIEPNLPGGGAAYQTTGSDLTDAGAVAPTGLGASRVGADESETLQLAEERLAVGKRLLNRGTTRIRRYVVETPVEEQVSLHEERVTLERRPVTGSVAPDAGSFTDRVIEMTESREEAVVSKTAHVTEEIRLRKEAVDRVETVRDTLRREEVEIEQVPGEPGTTQRP